MIQIDDWAVISGFVAIFLLFIIYLAYFIVTRKLFPKVHEFQTEVYPNEANTISTIEGSGIIKKIEFKTYENEKKLITIIIDQTSFITLSFSKKTSAECKNVDSSEEIFSAEINLNKQFEKNFILFLHNESDKVSYSKGKIYYEIKKPLKITLRTILSEIR